MRARGKAAGTGHGRAWLHWACLLVLLGSFSPAAASALEDAVRASDAEAVRALAADLPQAARDHALVLASSGSTAEVVGALLAAKASANAQDEDGYTALMLAAKNNRNVAVTRALLDAGAVVNASKKGNSWSFYSGYTSLMLAAKYNQEVAVTNALIAAGAAVNAQADYGYTVLMLAAGRNQEVAVTNALIAAGAAVNAQNKFGRTALMMAAKSDKRIHVVALIDGGAEVNARDQAGLTARDFAMIKKSTNTLGELPAPSTLQQYRSLVRAPKFYALFVIAVLAAAVAWVVADHGDSSADKLTTHDPVAARSDGVAQPSRGAVAVVMRKHISAWKQAGTKLYRFTEVVSNTQLLMLFMLVIRPHFMLPLLGVLYGLPCAILRRNQLTEPFAVRLTTLNTSMLWGLRGVVPCWQVIAGIFRIVLVCMLLQAVGEPERFTPVGLHLRFLNVLWNEAGREVMGLKFEDRKSEDLCLPWTNFCESLPPVDSIFQAYSEVLFLMVLVWTVLTLLLACGKLGIAIQDFCKAEDSSSLDADEGEQVLEKAKRVDELVEMAHRGEFDEASRREIDQMAKPLGHTVDKMVDVAHLGRVKETARREFDEIAKPLGLTVDEMVEAAHGGKFDDATRREFKEIAKPFGAASLKMTVLLQIVDVLSDLSTINTLLLSQQFYFAGFLLVPMVFSTVTEIAHGCLHKLPEEVRKSAATGVPTDWLLHYMDNERGSEALVSLLVSAYALPFGIRTPLQALLGIYSLTSSAWAVSMFIYDKVDLAIQPKDSAAPQSESESSSSNLSDTDDESSMGESESGQPEPEGDSHRQFLWWACGAGSRKGRAPGTGSRKLLCSEGPASKRPTSTANSA